MARRSALTIALIAALSTAAPARAADWTALVVGDQGYAVTPVDAVTHATGPSVAVGDLPLGVAISPDANTAYVVNLGLSPGSGSVSVIDLSRGAPRRAATVPITAGTPNFIAVSPAGGLAYVTSPGNGTVVPIDLTHTPPIAGTPISAGVQPEGVAFAPDGRTAYVADFKGDAVIPIDVATGSTGLPIRVKTGDSPFAIAVTPDGRTAYVTELNGSAVTPIDLATATAGNDIPVGANPQGIAITPDGGTAYVASGGAGTLTPVGTASGAVGSPIAVGDDPYGVAITPDGHTAYVTNGGVGDTTVVPVDLTAAVPVTGAPIPVATTPRAVAVTPDQAPVAAFAVASAPPGAASTFDASASSVSFGSIAAYRWTFGDGSAAVTTSQPIATHTFAAAGMYRTAVVETTAAGTSTSRVFTGQTTSRNGGPFATTGRVAVVAATPSPAEGKRATAEAVSGTVLIRLPGAHRFVPVGAGAQVPVGTVVDARHGVVRITAVSGGRPYSAVFYEGEFTFTQRAKRGATADIALFGGSFKGCPRAARIARNKSIRHLWGKGNGAFRTLGRFAAATVRGTTWDTEDDCTGTLVKVTAGKVLVRDFVKRKNIVVRAGHQYFAAAHGG